MPHSADLIRYYRTYAEVAYLDFAGVIGVAVCYVKFSSFRLLVVWRNDDIDYKRRTVGTYVKGFIRNTIVLLKFQYNFRVKLKGHMWQFATFEMFEFFKILSSHNVDEINCNYNLLNYVKNKLDL